MIYPRSLVPDGYADAILRICRQAKIEISKTFLPERFINRRILVTMYPSITPEEVMLAFSPDHESIVMILSTKDLTEYAKNHVYGFIHEVAHCFAYFKGDINQGWAIYASTRVFWNVVNNLGNQIWPTPINATEDIEKVWKLINAEEDPSNRAAKVFFDMDRLVRTRVHLSGFKESSSDTH